MPANVVKTERDERLWEKAKEQTHEGYPGVAGKRFYKITMGIYQKMKGGQSKSAGLGQLIRLGWLSSWPIGYFNRAKQMYAPGRYFKPYAPMGHLVKMSMEKEATFTGRDIALASAITAGVGATASMLPMLIQKIVDATAAKRAFGQAYEEFPDLKQYDRKKMKAQFSVIRDLAPGIAKNPYLLGSLLRQTGQYEAADREFIEALTRINEKVSPIGEDIAKAMEPYVRDMTRNITEQIIKRPTVQAPESRITIATR